MKTRLEVVIDAGRETVWRLFDDPDNLSKWQPTLKAFTPTSGIPGQPGATADLVYEERPPGNHARRDHYGAT